MLIRMHPRSTTLDLCNVTAAEAGAILQALRHELVRSQRRLDDERVGAETQKIEKDTRRLLNILLQTISEFAQPKGA